MRSGGIVLAFDFGRRRIGVAVGQVLGQTAQPLTTVVAADGRPDWRAISSLLSEWEPDELVVGIPVRQDRSPHEFAARVQRFARQLQGRYGLPVHCVDETLSSHEAHARQGPRGAGLDAVAAQLILETWWSVRLSGDAET